MGQHVRVLAIDLEHLKRNVAPARAFEGGIMRRVGRGFSDGSRFGGGGFASSMDEEFP